MKNKFKNSKIYKITLLGGACKFNRELSITNYSKLTIEKKYRVNK